MTKAAFRAGQMRSIIVLFAMLLAPAVASATVDRCRLIKEEKERLACFDKEFAPPVKPATEAPSGQEKSPNELLQMENELLAKRTIKCAGGVELQWRNMLRENTGSIPSLSSLIRVLCGEIAEPDQKNRGSHSALGTCIVTSDAVNAAEMLTRLASWGST